MEDLRRQLIEMLAFPRLKAFEALQLDACPHGGQFQSVDDGCRTCQSMFECSWIQSNEPFIALAQEAPADLVKSLRLACEYVTSRNHRVQGSRAFCVCETCRWIEKANRLIRTAEGQSETVRT